MIEKELKQKMTTLPGEVAETLAVERFYYDNQIVKLIAYAVMPNYPWLFDNNVDTASTPAKIRAMIKLGVPYPKDYHQRAKTRIFKTCRF